MKTNVIYNEDCLEGMKKLPDESIDIIITDPPYNIDLKPPRGITDSIQNDNMETDDFLLFLDKVYSEVNRVLK